jgi:hypothetical protein
MLSQLQWQQLKNLDICYSEIIIAINESERILQEFFPHLYEEAEKSWIWNEKFCQTRIFSKTNNEKHIG